eukprot:362204-Chlamydomonas_euryale.AAC.2
MPHLAQAVHLLVALLNPQLLGSFPQTFALQRRALFGLALRCGVGSGRYRQPMRGAGVWGAGGGDWCVMSCCVGSWRGGSWRVRSWSVGSWSGGAWTWC